MGGELSIRLPDELAEKLRGYSFSRHPYDETEAENRWIPLFFKHYGLEEMDKKKLSYYRKLIELI